MQQLYLLKQKRITTNKQTSNVHCDSEILLHIQQTEKGMVL